MLKQINNNEDLLNHLIDLLNKGNAHVSLDEALSNIRFGLLGELPNNVPYTLYQLAQHIKIAQWDILEFSRNESYVSPEWPKGYWPEERTPTSKTDWDDCVEQIKTDRQSFIDLLKKNTENLYTPFSYGDGQTLLKEALVLADHNAYHTGEIVIVRRLLNDWKRG